VRLALLTAFAVPEHDVLQRRQPFQADGAACVQLVVRDADFRAEAELEAVGEAVDAFTITLAESTSRRKRIARS
jgi:hypothetical protein